MDHDEQDELKDEEQDLFLGDEDDDAKKIDEEDPFSMGFHEVEPEPEPDY